MKSLVKSMSVNLSYNQEAKDKFHRAAKKALKKIAEDIGLNKEEYDLRSNKGGIAVSGEVTLHGDKIYIQISKECMPNTEIMYRACYGRKDYCGKTNNFMSVSDLEKDYDKAIRNFKRVMEN